jgi:predicted nuclease with RNAse H fold
VGIAGLVGVVDVVETVALGVDVGAERLHVVGLSAAGAFTVTDVVNSRDLDRFRDLVRTLSIEGVVAIDGPAGSSVGAYADDVTISQKFRLARGCEVELGRQRRIWVSFATGPGPLTGWMLVAELVHECVIRAERRALETYPHAVYTTLNGARPPKKSTADGITERVRLLREAGVDDPSLPLWSHDGLDAAAAAIVALHAYRGTAEAVVSERDGTSIWLPPRPDAAGLRLPA